MKFVIFPIIHQILFQNIQKSTKISSLYQLYPSIKSFISSFKTLDTVRLVSRNAPMKVDSPHHSLSACTTRWQFDIAWRNDELGIAERVSRVILWIIFHLFCHFSLIYFPRNYIWLNRTFFFCFRKRLQQCEKW